MSRRKPYIHKPPPFWSEDIATLNDTKLYLVSNIGPTVFILKGDDSLGASFKVLIGDVQMCSCGGGEARSRLCVHILFITIKVLKVPITNPITWQLSLTSNEVDHILSGQHLLQAPSARLSTHRYLRKRQDRTLNKSTGDLRDDNASAICKARPLDENSSCAICMDALSIAEEAANLICYCQIGCGAPFHKKCFKMFSMHHRSEMRPILCPLCRSQWTHETEDKKETQQLNSSPAIECQACHINIKTAVFRCAICVTIPTFDLCKRCFDKRDKICGSSDHCDHCFVTADLTKYPPFSWFVPVPRKDSNRVIWHTIQRRELVEADYETLLSLDDKLTMPIYQHLLTTLPIVKSTIDNNGPCSLCNSPLVVEKTCRVLPCRNKHIAHESCTIALLMEAASSGGLGISNVSCPTCQDVLFPSLARNIVTKSDSRKRTSCKVGKESVSDKETSQDKCIKTSTEQQQKHIFNECIIGISHVSLGKAVSSSHTTPDTMHGESSNRCTNKTPVGTFLDKGKHASSVDSIMVKGMKSRPCSNNRNASNQH